ncbi:hypothetical protein PoB_006583700 [Plakobranchus ocellatus]|uniref:Uncharacterized protein n=1 Tax=Plakobranchus ocellatus TaxID=259542 RepID=A0AAV4D553_9GAST|nr:hypothetical protein PoB_006583700 [Plakobranchus ocellatus]
MFVQGQRNTKLTKDEHSNWKDTCGSHSNKEINGKLLDFFGLPNTPLIHTRHKNMDKVQPMRRGGGKAVVGQLLPIKCPRFEFQSGPSQFFIAPL